MKEAPLFSLVLQNFMKPKPVLHLQPLIMGLFFQSVEKLSLSHL